GGGGGGGGAGGGGEVAGAEGGRGDRLAERCGEAERLEPREPGERGAARGAHLPAQILRGPPGLERELRGAEDRLSGQAGSHLAREPDRRPGLDERFEEGEEIGRAAAGEARHGVEQRLVGGLPRDADALEEAPRPGPAGGGAP